MRSLLVGIDDSDYSRAAVDLALRWAAGQNLTLVGLGIVDIPDLAAPEPVPLGAGAYKVERDEQVVHAARRTVEQLLQGFSLRCSQAGVPSKVLENEGAPADQIVAESHRVDAIVLGQRTNFDLEGEALSTEALPEVVHRSPRPVISVPIQVPSGTNVVIAYDGSLQASRALQMFQLSGLSLGGAVHVLSVSPDKLHAAREADRAADFLRSHGIVSTEHAIHSTLPPATAILDQVQALDAGLLVMGAYGQPTLKEFFFGSVTRTVLAQSPVPTFLYA